MAKWTLEPDAPVAPTVAASPAPTGKWTLEQETETPQRSTIQEIGRQVGLTARAGIKGITAIPAMFGDAVGLNSSGSVDAVLDRFLPKPEGSTERVAQDVASAMAGGGALSAGGRVLAQARDAVTRGVGNVLASGPGMNVVSSGTGAGASGITREEGGGAVAQTIAGLTGAIAPVAAVGVGSAAVRGTARGGEAGRQEMVRRMEVFRDAGVESPTVGQAAGTRGMQATESGLSRVPAGAGRIIARAEEEAGQMGARVAGVADDLAKGVDDTKAGLTIERGVRDFTKRFKATQNQLYNGLDQYIPAQSAVDVTNTRQALAALNADIPNAPALSAWFKNGRIEGIEAALTADTAAGGTLPFEALKKLRTLVGQELSDHTLASNVPKSKWKSLYAALSRDMETAATAAGPEAERVLARANNYTSAGMARIENVLDRVLGDGKAAETIYQAATGGARNGATTINSVMRSLTEPEREVVRSAFIRRLGEATPGQQGAEGGAFSARTFLTDWNKIDPNAKRILFAGRDGQVVKDLDAVAKAAEMIDKGSKVFANPSGTGQAVTMQQTVFGMFLAAATGNVGVASGIGAGLLGANATSRLMTNPEFVKWLARSTKTPAGALPGTLNTLAQTASKWDDADRAAAEEVIQSLQQQSAR